MSADAKLASLAAKVDALGQVMERLARAVEALVRIEAKQATAEREIADHEVRLRTIEKSQPGLLEMRLWIIGGFGAVSAAILVAAFTGHITFQIIR